LFRRRQFFTGTSAPDTTRDGLDWYRPNGLPMTPQDWSASFARAVTLALSGDTGAAGVQPAPAPRCKRGPAPPLCVG
jgi:hypothetical protein